MKRLEQLESRVTILRARERRVRLQEPVIVDGVAFTEKLATVYEPYHRKVAAHVQQSEGGGDGGPTVVVIRRIRDLEATMRVDVAGVQHVIESIAAAAQQVDDRRVEFNVLTCREATDGANPSDGGSEKGLLAAASVLARDAIAFRNLGGGGTEVRLPVSGDDREPTDVMDPPAGGRVDPIA